MSRVAQLESIAARSKKPLPWYGLAMEYRAAGDHDRARATFAKVHELDPSYVPAYFMCGQLLAELGLIPEARAELAQGIDVATRVGDQHALLEMRGLLQTLDE
jgi:tetratricopeptide (TPR) repeat protein